MYKNSKVGILTHHTVHNHGAVLQLYALIKVLNELGVTAKALDYQKNYDFLEEGIEKKYNISLQSVPYYVSYLLKNGGKRTVFNIKKRITLNRFKFKRNMVGEYYSHAKNLNCVFIGSDEVFSIEAGINPFFWGIGVPAKHIFSYAASFGPTTQNDIEKWYAVEFIKAGIHRIEKISVRDKNSQELLKKNGNIEVPQLCDPVILYEFPELKRKHLERAKNKYLIVYAYDNNMNDEAEIKRIKEFAKKNNFKIISPGFYHSWCDKNINVSPLELLLYIKNAEYVITDTFHGTVMSIIANRRFAVKVRNNSPKINFLLKEYELEERKTNDLKDLNYLFVKEINYKRVNEIIQAKRKEGMNFLKECLESVRDE